MTAEEWDDINQHVRDGWKAETTPFERVYEIVEQTQTGQSAATIAGRALVSEPTARRHCKALVNTGFAETERDGQTTLYKRNSDRVLMTRIQELREEATREELIEGIQQMKTTIREYEDRYDVLSPEALVDPPVNSYPVAILTEDRPARRCQSKPLGSLQTNRRA